jgi:transporter family-2 protein
VHLSGAVLSGALLFLRGGEKIREWQSLPWYMLIAGLWGLVLYLTISVTLPRLGGATVIMLVIVGQLIAGAVIDHFGWLNVPVHPISVTRILGIGVLLVGGWLIAR